MHYLIVLVLLLLNLSFAKEIFTEKDIKQYMTEENPFIYSIIGKKYIYEGKLKYYKGFFDTNLSGKYEKKEYPLSTSDFYSLFIDKPTYKGFDFSFGYRKAKGVQEFNNIKTGENGEILIGLKIPVFNIRQNIDERRLNLFLTNIDLEKINYEYQDKFRKLYLKILSSYYKVLYYKQIFEIEKEVLKKAEERMEFIVKKIEGGALPSIYQVEANQHIINRKQRLLKAENEYITYLNDFLKYIGISNEKFNQMYELPELPDLPELKMGIDEAVKVALENRPDLKALKLEEIKLKKEKTFYNLLKYPKFNVSIYGVHDFKYDNGYKISLDAVYSIERRKYLGKTIEIGKSIFLINKKQEKILIELKTNLKNIIETLNALKLNIKNSEQEISLVKKLEEVERKKFKLGSGNLFLINQREIYSLETLKKNLKYRLDYLILYKKFFAELNIL